MNPFAVFFPAFRPGLLLAALACASAAQAQTAPAREVTRDELRVCMAGELALQARRQAVEARGPQNAEEAVAIRAEAKELAEEQQRLQDRQASMDRFDRKVKAHNARVKAAQGGAEALRAEFEALNREVVSYNQQCGTISFRPEDKEAILKERAAQQK